MPIKALYVYISIIPVFSRKSAFFGIVWGMLDPLPVFGSSDREKPVFRFSDPLNRSVMVYTTFPKNMVRTTEKDGVFGMVYTVKKP